MATHSSTLVWKIPWMEEPGRLQAMRSLRDRHNWATSLSLFTFMHWRRKWQPTPVFLPGESQGWGSPMGCPIYGVTQSRTRLKRLSSSSSQSIGASASDLPLNTQDWFPLGWTSLILQSKRFSRVFSNTTVQSINSLALNNHKVFQLVICKRGDLNYSAVLFL